MDADLLETLRDAQRFGFFGPGPIEDAARHAEMFVRAIGDLTGGTRLVDLGSGGGLPGLVLASAYPSTEIVLIDRRQKRTDFLRRAVRRLGFDHVEVVTGDVAALITDVDAGRTPPFDVVTARGFGPPDTTLRMAVRLMAAGGRIAISEPPSGDRWDPELLTELSVHRTAAEQIAVFRR